MLEQATEFGLAKAAGLFSAETGARPGEMFALTWDMVDMRTCSATYTMGKTGHVKTVVFSKTTKELMEAIPPVKSAHVFYNRVGNAFTEDSWRSTAYWAAKRAGTSAGAASASFGARGRTPTRCVTRTRQKWPRG